MTKNKADKLKNNEEFEVINVSNKILYTSMSRSTKKSYISLIDYKPIIY